MQISWIVAFFAGLYGQQMIKWLLLFPALAVTPILGAIWFYFGKEHGVYRKQFQVAGYLFFFSLGILWAAFRGYWALSYRLPAVLEKQTVVVSGTISSVVEQESNHRVSFDFDVDKIQSDFFDDAHYLPRALRVSWRNVSETITKPQGGQRWQLTLQIKSTHRNQNPYNFDSELRYIQSGIDGFGSVLAKESPPVLLDSLHVAPKYLLLRVRQNIHNRIQENPKFTGTQGLVSALTIGYQHEVPPFLWEIFSSTGTNHLFSISGLHLSAISLLTASLFGFWWRQSPKRLHNVPVQQIVALVAALMAILYCGIGGAGVPLQRSALMVVTACLLLYSKRSLTGLSILANALLVVIVVDPWAPLFPGFWLSFWGVALIILSAKWLSSGQLAHYQWLKAARLQILISLGMIPVTLWFFQQISLVSVVANLVLIPLVTLIILPITLLAALTNIGFLSVMANQELIWMIDLLSWFAHWPFAVQQMARPPVWTVILALAGLIFWVKVQEKGRWLGVLCVFPLFLWPGKETKPGEAEIVIFDVGQGNAAIVHTANHHLIIDTGPFYKGFRSSASRIILPYLRERGIRSVDGILISHQDMDHAGGLSDLIKNIQIGWLLSPMPLQKPRQIPYVSCLAPKVWVWDQVRFEILFPAKEDSSRYNSGNDTSCLIKISTRKGQILFTGDLGTNPQRMLTQKGNAEKLQAEIMLAPHHGSMESFSGEFAQKVKPAHVIFSSGYLNRYRHPDNRIIAWYQQQGITVWRTDQQGAILINLGKEKSRVSAWRDKGRHYWWF